MSPVFRQVYGRLDDRCWLTPVGRLGSMPWALGNTPFDGRRTVDDGDVREREAFTEGGQQFSAPLGRV